MKKLRELAAGLAVVAGAGGLFGVREAGKVETSAATAEAKEQGNSEKTVFDEGFAEYQVELTKINNTIESVEAIDIDAVSNFAEVVSDLLYKDNQLAGNQQNSKLQTAAGNGRKIIADKLALVLHASDKWIGSPDGKNILERLVKVLPSETIREASLLHDNVRDVLRQTETRNN